MPQTEKVKTGFQSNIWDKGIEVIRFVKEREKTFREKLEDDFCEGRAVQVEEPLYVTFKHALKKDLKLKRMRAERKKDAKEQQVYYFEGLFLSLFSSGGGRASGKFFKKFTPTRGKSAKFLRTGKSPNRKVRIFFWRNPSPNQSSKILL